MTGSYTKDRGEIYLSRIDYTGNAALSPSNYVQFYLETRPDAPPMFTAKASVVTAYRLKTIDVWGNGSRVRAYALGYTNPGATFRSILASVQQYGTDATVDASGTVTGGTALPATTFGWNGDAPGTFTSLSPWPSASAGWCDPAHLKTGDFNGDGKRPDMQQ
jgi:hypothetical protein